MDTDIVVKASGVTKHYGDVKAVQNVTLQVSSGQLYGLVGPDGAGKSTLLRILAGALPSQGDVALWGNSLRKHRAHLCEQIGYVPQRFSLYGDLTVAENLRFVGKLYGMSQNEVNTAGTPLLEWAGLVPFTQRQAAYLSGGMKQKLSLIAALLHSTRLLLLDEPTTAVDPVARLDFWRMLRELAGQGVTILVSTVYLDEASQCDEVAMMYAGQILAQGAPDELRQTLPYQVYEVALPGGERLAVSDMMRCLPGAAQAIPYGSRWRVLTEVGSEADIARWEELLAAAGTQARVRTVQATLEDVFVYLLEQKEAGAA